MHIALFIKVIYCIQILLKKIRFILFFLRNYFSDEWSKFLILQFIETKSQFIGKKLTSIYLRTKIKISLCITRGKVSPEKGRKSLLLIRYHIKCLIRTSKLMPWDTLWSLALGHVRATASSTNSCLGLSCGRAMRSQLICNMSGIVNDNHSKKKVTYTRLVPKIQISDRNIILLVKEHS